MVTTARIYSPWRKPGLWGVGPSQRRMRTGSPSGCCPAWALRGGESRSTSASPSSGQLLLDFLSERVPRAGGAGGAEPTYAFLQLQAASSLSASLSLILSPPPRPPSFTSLLQAPSPCCCRASPFHGLKAGTGQVAGNEGPGSAGRGPGFWLDFSQASWPCPGPHTHHYFWDLLGDGQAGLALRMGFKVLLSQAGRVRRGVTCSSSLCHPPLFPSFL